MTTGMYKSLLLGIVLITGVSAQAQSNFNIGLGLNFGSGGYPAPMPMPMPYPVGPVCTGGGYFPGGGGYYPGGGGYFPGGYPGGINPGFPGGFPPGSGNGLMPPVIGPFRTPSPFVPPHLIYGQGGWGGGYGAYPGPGYVSGPTCGIPCSIGYQPMPAYPVPGGPAIMGPCGGVIGTCGMGGIYGGLGPMPIPPMPMPMTPFPVAGGPGPVGGGVAGGGNVINVGMMNEWEKNDTAPIVWGTAVGVGLNSSSVYPLMAPRSYFPPIASPLLYQTGDRSFGFDPRMHGAGF